VRRLDFWFDFSSPFTYLASTRVDALAARTGATLRWRPMLLGAVFKAVGQVDIPIAAMSEAKRQYSLKDLHRWADLYGVPFQWNATFPLRTVLPLRVFLLHPDPVGYAHRVFRAAWGESRDVSDPAVLLDCGATPEQIDAAPTMRQPLIESTRAAVDAGAFGAPTFVVDDSALFFGNDRLDLVERALTGWTPPG
jgi:2-hydroxychromene-2-carboxylate isomerase